MDLNKLYYFYVVAKHQHITHAAQELYISQPALTKAMKLLEQNLGVDLFQKQNRNLYLTPLGEHLKKRLDTVFPVLDRIPDELNQMREQAMHTVKLNVLVASIITTDAIAKYKTQNAHVNFQVFQNNEDWDCDISITTDIGVPGRLPNFSKSCVIEEEVFLAVPKDSKYAKLDSIDLQDVKDEWFVNVSNARSFRILCDNFCLSAGFKPNVTFESDFPVAIRNLINAGAGIGFWPAFSFGEISPDMKLLPIKQPRCQRKLIIGLNSNSAASESTIDFYNYLIEYLKQQKESLYS